jgi:hypothetical protein
MIMRCAYILDQVEKDPNFDVTSAPEAHILYPAGFGGLDVTVIGDFGQVRTCKADALTIRTERFHFT